MIVISKTPLRIGLGGGGTDIKNYFINHGGAVLNATINLFVYCSIQKIKKNEVICDSIDLGIFENQKKKSKLNIVWNTLEYFKENYNLKINNIHIKTYSSVPAGSGLGSSSAIVVSLIKSLIKYYNLNLSKKKIVKISYIIEREMSKLKGGYQDYISAVYGGMNFIIFHKNGDFSVKKIKIKTSILRKLEMSCTLFFTGVSRNSSKIIDQQISSLNHKNKILFLHKIKKYCYILKEDLIKEDLNSFMKNFQKSSNMKKKSANLVSTKKIEKIENFFYDYGAQSMKISGAGGGGYLIILSKEDKTFELRNHANKMKNLFNFQFYSKGSDSWIF